MTRSGRPGDYPFTRGIHSSMYRGRLWTMRQFAGFGTSEETNERFHYLLDHGQTGLSTAFDMPSLMGHDSDHARSLGEVGREGVAVDTLDDMQTLFSGIDLGEVSVSMTINAPAAIMLAFYVVAAEQDGDGVRWPAVAPERLSGTIQADILKEYIAQKEWCFPIDPAMRLCGDMIEWCTRHMPRWHPISISGYHIREAGSTAQQELAFTLKDGLTYVEQAVARGLDVDEFAPRLSFFFNAQIDFFEEIAKYRAARRIWARELRETFGAKNPRSWQMRFHSQTAGVSLTAQQPLNNIVRTAIEALAAVLGRHAVAAHQLLRRGARAADRGGRHDRAAHAADDRPRDRRHQHGRPARRLLLRRGADRRDGTARATSTSPRSTSSGAWSRRSSATTPSARSPTRRSRCSRRSTPASGSSSASTASLATDEEPIPTLRVDPALERKQIGRLQAARARRDGAAVERTLAALREDAAHARAQPDGAAAGLRPRARQRGRDRRVAAAGLRRLLARPPVFLSGACVKHLSSVACWWQCPARARSRFGRPSGSSRRERRLPRARSTAAAYRHSSNRSAVLPPVRASPYRRCRGRYDASPHTQISLLGAPPSTLSAVTASGSRADRTPAS